MKKAYVLLALLLTVLLAGCPGSSGNGDESGAGAPGPVAAKSMFVDGCPVPGIAGVKLITDPDFGVQGPDGLGGVGDYLLMNDKAAFVIQGPGNINTYYYYSGIPIDAVALNGCAQAGPERYQELGLMVGFLDMSSLPDSIANSWLRAFKGEWAEIINDGSNGQAAVLRIHGTDDTFWLTELELLLTFTGIAGPPVPLSTWQQFDIYVDYTLEPGSQVMKIDIYVHNTTAVTKEVITGLASFFGDTTELNYAYQGKMSAPGGIDFSLNIGIPWLVASNGDGAWALAMKDASLATLKISGVDGIVDANRVSTGHVVLAPDETSPPFTYFFSVGGGDSNTATVPLKDVNPVPLTHSDSSPIQHQTYPISGQTLDIVTGQAVPNAEVVIQTKNASGGWVFMESFVSDANGDFSGLAPLLELPDPPTAPEFRVYGIAEGRDNANSVTINPTADTPLAVKVLFMPGGKMSYYVHDETGAPLPCKIQFYQPLTRNVVKRLFTPTGYGMEPVEPGAYDVSITRGFEYTTDFRRINIPSNGEYYLDTTLERVVDTTGWMSADTHIHARPSGDNNISIPERIRTVAGEGLEVAVSTDHENIVSWQFGIDENHLGAWVATVLGQEVSCGVPGHSNIYPIPVEYNLNKRGDPVQWWNSQVNPDYSMDVAELFGAERARGAQIIQVNHPRDTGIFGTVKYDRVNGVATEDPANIGMRPGADLWSWDFNAFEYINGNKRVFKNPGNPDHSGTFEDWMSFLNLGHRKTAMGGSDAHNYEEVGYPRDFFPSSSDSPAQFKVAELVNAIKNGQIIVSTGAFARVALYNDLNESAGMGGTINATNGHVKLWLRIEALPDIDVVYFMVFVNGLEVADVSTTDPDGLVKYDGEVDIPIDRDSHVEVLGFGYKQLPRGLEEYDPCNFPRFTTNPIYVDYEGNDNWIPPGTATEPDYTPRGCP